MVTMDNFDSSSLDIYDINLVQKEVGGGVISFEQIDTIKDFPDSKYDIKTTQTCNLLVNLNAGMNLTEDYYYGVTSIARLLFIYHPKVRKILLTNAYRMMIHFQWKIG